MRYHPFLVLATAALFAPAVEDAPPAGGGSPPAPAAATPAEATQPVVTPPVAAAPPAAVAAAPPASAAPAAESRPPSVLERIQATLGGTGTLLAESEQRRVRIEQLTTDLAGRDATISSQNSRIATLEAENARLNTEMTGIEALLKGAKAEAVSVDGAAARILAGMGADPDTLPAASTEGTETTDSILQKISQTKDPEKLYTLSAQLAKLEEGEGSN